MNPNDFVYKAVLNGSLKAGVNQTIAHQQAVIALDRYKKSNFSGAKVGKFIQDMMAQAKKLSKGVK